MEHADKIRVLIADDSFFIRRFLVETLSADPAIEVVGVATSGDEVVRLAGELRPDVITMDYHMPGKNGMEAAAAIMLGERPLPAIIMLSAFEGADGREAKRSLEASGAQVIAKPSGEVSLDIEKITADIIAKIKEVGIVEVKMRKVFSRLHSHDRHHAISTEKGGEPRLVVVIGASTGGPPLVEHLLSSLDPDTGIAVVIIQHMSKYFTELFAERLNRVTGFTVREAESGDALLPGLALVIPGGMILERSFDGGDDRPKPDTNTFGLALRSLTPGEGEDEIDRAMAALAIGFGERACGVLLSGMGADGGKGLGAIRSKGGYTIAQDPHTAAVSSMPAHAISAGVVDAMLPVEEIAPHILSRLASTAK